MLADLFGDKTAFLIDSERVPGVWRAFPSFSHAVLEVNDARVFAGILDRAINLEPLGRRASAVIWRDFHLDAILPRIEQALARAAGEPRSRAGSAAEAYQLALLAERCTQALVHETQAA